MNATIFIKGIIRMIAIVSVITFLMSFVSCQAQQVIRVTTEGNYVVKKSPKADTTINTGKTFTDTKGNVYPVYMSKNGKLFIIRISRTGNVYKQYLRI